MCLSLRHLCGCLSAANDDNTHAALPTHTVPDAGQARYYDSSRRRRGRWLSMGVGSLLSSLPLSLPLWGVVACCRVDCVDAPCVGASPFPPTPSGVGLSCAAGLVLRPPFTRVGREAACEVNNPHAALRWGAHTELLEASVRCRWVRTLCVCTAAAVRAGESQRDLGTRCLCHLPPGPSFPPCLPRSPSPCPVASCLTRWRCP